VAQYPVLRILSKEDLGVTTGGEGIGDVDVEGKRRMSDRG